MTHHHMWAHQEVFNIKWREVSRTYPKHKKPGAKNAPLPRREMGQTKFQNFAPKKGISNRIFPFHFYFQFLCKISH
jgi:hypothetical protein